MVQTTGRGPAVAVLKMHKFARLLDYSEFRSKTDSKLIPFKGILTDKSQIRNDRITVWSLAFIKITQRHKEEV